MKLKGMKRLLVGLLVVMGLCLAIAMVTMDLYFLIGGVVCFAVFEAVMMKYWRCPHCFRRLGRLDAGTYCPHCGKNMYNETGEEE